MPGSASAESGSKRLSGPSYPTLKLERALEGGGLGGESVEVSVELREYLVQVFVSPLRQAVRDAFALESLEQDTKPLEVFADWRKAVGFLRHGSAPTNAV